MMRRLSCSSVGALSAVSEHHGAQARAGDVQARTAERGEFHGSGSFVNEANGTRHRPGCRIRLVGDRGKVRRRRFEVASHRSVRLTGMDAAVTNVSFERDARGRAIVDWSVAGSCDLVEIALVNTPEAVNLHWARHGGRDALSLPSRRPPVRAGVCPGRTVGRRHRRDRRRTQPRAARRPELP